MTTERKFTRWDSIEDRLWSRVEKTESCWLWTGDLNRKGYSTQIGFNKEYTTAHRIAYMLLVGPIPDGLVLDHLCRVRNCVNPDHLEPVTQEENTRRGVDARWLEDCPNGHPAPLYRKTIPSGKNVCLACRRIGDKRRDDANRDARRAAARTRHANKKRSAA